VKSHVIKPFETKPTPVPGTKVVPSAAVGEKTKTKPVTKENLDKDTKPLSAAKDKISVTKSASAKDRDKKAPDQKKSVENLTQHADATNLNAEVNLVFVDYLTQNSQIASTWQSREA
jgi:hypothetical protein